MEFWSDYGQHGNNRIASGFPSGVRLMVTETQHKSSMENRPRIDRYEIEPLEERVEVRLVEVIQPGLVEA